ncbi:hypothetical protein [Ruminococcus flavefaciens]|nr:hypothetical protein [Ruminococcus flavefaciens]
MMYITGNIHASPEPIFDLAEKYEPQEAAGLLKKHITANNQNEIGGI